MKLDGLQAGRAIAAFMVVIFHANVYTLPTALYQGRGAGPVFSMGYAGVEYFFVLSGFIMLLVHRKDFGVPRRAWRFVARRVIRIYPIYWLVLTALVAMYFAFPALGPDYARDPSAIATSYLLLPTPQPPILELAWTLRHEMLFYLVFVLAIVDLRLGIGVFAAWMAACAFGLAADFGHYLTGFLFSPYNILFLFGMVAATQFSRVGTGLARVLLAAGLAAFLAVGLSEVFGLVRWELGPRTICYGLAAMAMVTGLAAGAVPIPRILVLFGDASYSLYLVHIPAMSLFVKIAVRIGAPWGLPPLAMLVVLVVFCAVAGLAMHLIVERPLLAFLSRLAFGGRETRAAPVIVPDAGTR